LGDEQKTATDKGGLRKKKTFPRFPRRARTVRKDNLEDLGGQGRISKMNFGNGHNELIVKEAKADRGRLAKFRGVPKETRGDLPGIRPGRGGEMGILARSPQSTGGINQGSPLQLCMI